MQNENDSSLASSGAGTSREAESVRQPAYLIAQLTHNGYTLADFMRDVEPIVRGAVYLKIRGAAELFPRGLAIHRLLVGRSEPDASTQPTEAK